MEIIERRAFLKCFDSGASYNAEVIRVTVSGTIKKNERREPVDYEWGLIRHVLRIPSALDLTGYRSIESQNLKSNP